ncbi:FAD-dependent oxidoreductase [Halobacteria archaeon HArc-gm2]|nr:FAD-dependent oxidoreductase [Halobacteria archaeon HArc-gm2]
MSDVVVAGGGLAGLVAARHLAESGADVTVFERESRVGGRVRSRRLNGYTVDRGFQVLFSAYPAVRRELNLDALDLRYFTPGATIARPGERSVLVDPRRAPTDGLATLFNGDVTFGDKLRLFILQRELAGRTTGEILNRGGTSTREYLDRVGFSTKFVDNFAAPFYGGITLDRDLETDSLVFEYTFKMLSEGRIGVPAAGMGAIPDQLAKRAEMAGATIETDATVSSVESSSTEAVLTVDGETVVADAVVVATDPPTARDLTGVGSIPTEARSCVTLSVARQSRTGLPTGKRLVLNADESGPNQVAPLSAVAPEYAPSDATLYSATFLGEREESDEALFESVQETMASWYPEANLADLELVATDRVPFAQFAQPPGFRVGLPPADDPDGPVFLAGDYTRWSSIQGALESGRVAADAVVEELGR